MNDQPQYAVECEALGRIYRFSRGIGRGSTQETVALDDLNLTITPGSVFGLLGPNGAGKTTTVRILATLLTPTSGTARVLGYDVVDEPKRVREHIGLILGGDRGLYTRLSGRQNLSYHAALNHMDRRRARERREELLALVGLSDAADTAVERYSRGMKQRLHIARGLLTEPEVVFMDEPTIGLDPIGAQEVRTMIPELAAAGHTILLTTHYMFEADQLCDEVAIINEGKLVARDTPAAIRRRFATFRVIELAVREPDLGLADRLGALPGVEHVAVGSDGALQTFSIRVPPDADLRSAVEETAGSDNVESLLQRDPTLEEAYLALLS
ncbi:MAG: ABC transporter ATP-binding protein [Chloroflexi bacterium]|nr:ABC transporter ATP-binding protein [Chloroflexota bacterium]